MIRLSSFVLVASFLGSALAGCGSSDDTEASLKSSDLPTGVSRVSCYLPADKHCRMQGESSADGIQSRKDACTSESGTPSDHCPSDALAGCCVIAGLGDCYYDAATASSDESTCNMVGGKWQTSAP